MPVPRLPLAEKPGSSLKPPLPPRLTPPHRISIPQDPKKPPSSPRSSLHIITTYTIYALLALLLLLIFVLVASIVIYAWLRPHAPEFQLTYLNFTSLTLTPTNNQYKLTSTINIIIQVHNMNDAIHLGFDHMKILVFVGEVKIGRAVVAAFAEGEGNVTVMAVQGGVENVVVSKDGGNGVMEKFGEGKMKVDLQVESVMDSFIGEWHTGGFPVTALCLDVELDRLGSGFRPKCPVYLYGWIRIW